MLIIIAPTWLIQTALITWTRLTCRPRVSRGSHPAALTILQRTQKSFTNEDAKLCSSTRTLTRSPTQTAKEAESQCPAYCATQTDTNRKSSLSKMSLRLLYGDPAATVPPSPGGNELLKRSVTRSSVSFSIASSFHHVLSRETVSTSCVGGKVI